MQPSEMTNEKILSLAELCFYEDHSVEEDQQTAAVLRDYVRMRSEIAELREYLKVAEDALEKIDNMIDGDMCKFFDNTHHCSACRYLEKCQTGVAHAALTAIRGKGGANNATK